MERIRVKPNSTWPIRIHFRRRWAELQHREANWVSSATWWM